MLLHLLTLMSLIFGDGRWTQDRIIVDSDTHTRMHTQIEHLQPEAIDDSDDSPPGDESPAPSSYFTKYLTRTLDLQLAAFCDWLLGQAPSGMGDRPRALIGRASPLNRVLTTGTGRYRRRQALPPPSFQPPLKAQPSPAKEAKQHVGYLPSSW
jgi:hypothetical protein